MMKLLKNANIYTPSPIGKKDILIEGEKILRIADHIDGYKNLPDVEIYDLNGKTVVPGYIDMHVHITGGGGEQGPVSQQWWDFWVRMVSPGVWKIWWQRRGR